MSNHTPNGRRRRKRHHEEEHENHERWLITYADMITLLMVLFIVLFAMGQIDINKYNQLRGSLSDTFNGQSPALLNGSASILADEGSLLEPISPMSLPGTPQQSREIDEALRKAKFEQDQAAYAAALAEADRLLELQRQVERVLIEKGLDDDVETDVNAEGLRISLVSRNVIFEANRAELTARGRQIITTVVPVLSAIDNNLRIEGHTNQAPGKPLFFASDWDLSSARAISVLRLLNEQFGIDQNRLSAVGYGKTRPLLPVSDPTSQEINKRVDVIVRTTLKSETGSLLSRAVSERTGLAVSPTANE